MQPNIKDALQLISSDFAGNKASKQQLVGSSTLNNTINDVLSSAGKSATLIELIKAMEAKNAPKSLLDIGESAKMAVALPELPTADPIVDLNTAVSLLQALRTLRSEHRGLVASMFSANDSVEDIQQELDYRKSDLQQSYRKRSLANAKERLKASRAQLDYLTKQQKIAKTDIDNFTSDQQILTESLVAHDIGINSLGATDAEADNRGIAAAAATSTGKLIVRTATGTRREAVAFGHAYLSLVGAMRSASAIKQGHLSTSAAREQAIQSVKAAEEFEEALTWQQRDEDRAIESLDRSLARFADRAKSIVSNFSIRLESLLVEYASTANFLHSTSHRLARTLTKMGISYPPFDSANLLADTEDDEKIIADHLTALIHVSRQLAVLADYSHTTIVKIPLYGPISASDVDASIRLRLNVPLAMSNFGPSRLLGLFVVGSSIESVSVAVPRTSVKFGETPDPEYAWLPLVVVADLDRISTTTPGVLALSGVLLPTNITLEIELASKLKQVPYLCMIVSVLSAQTQ